MKLKIDDKGGEHVDFESPLRGEGRKGGGEREGEGEGEKRDGCGSHDKRLSPMTRPIHLPHTPKHGISRSMTQAKLNLLVSKNEKRNQR